MPSPQEKAAQELLAYCSSVGITVNPALKAKSVPGAGTGIYTSTILKSERTIISVPTKHILTTANIPDAFLPKSARDGIAVHAQLAAYLAFGTAEQLDQYSVWMATWPDLEDLLLGMPMFWKSHSECLSHVSPDSNPQTSPTEEAEPQRTSKRRKLVSNVDGRDSPTLWPGTNIAFSLSPGLTGWHFREESVPGMLPKMVSKLISHIESIAQVKPELDIYSPAQLVKFLYMWTIVNTRCFYYVPPATKKVKKVKKITDPNEAMALCPFMDLFNHTSTLVSSSMSDDLPTPCKVRYASTGFEVTTGAVLKADSEVLLSYGALNNDILWAEYGFMIPDGRNINDNVLLDELVLPSFTEVDKQALEVAGYSGTYTLHADGSVCYRTEMAAWCKILGRQKWAKVVAEGLDPAESCTSPMGKEKFVSLLADWMSLAVKLAEDYLQKLKALNDDEVLSIFGTISIISNVMPSLKEDESRIARKRCDMCIARWEQVLAMASRGIENIQQEN